MWELPDGLHLGRQWHRPVGGDVVATEIHPIRRQSKKALCWIDDQSVFTEMTKEKTEVREVLLLECAGNKDVIQVNKDECRKSYPSPVLARHLSTAGRFVQYS